MHHKSGRYFSTRPHVAQASSLPGKLGHRELLRDASRVSAARPHISSTGEIMQRRRHGATRPMSGDVRGA